MKFKSAVFAQASGSQGGTVYSHNKGGQYTRNRTIPTNPNTVLQQQVRSTVAMLSQRWGSVLTPTQRNDWFTYAAAVPIINSLGDPRTIPALSMYIRCNTPRVQAALPIADDGPTTLAIGTFTPVILATATPTTVDFTIDPTDPWATAVGGALLCWASIAISPGVNFFKGPFRFNSATLGAVVPPTSPITITPTFTIPTPNNCWFRFASSDAEGRLSTSQILFNNF